MHTVGRRPLKAKLQSDLNAAATDAAAEEVRAQYEIDERKLEHSIDHTPLEMHCELSVAYNFLSK